MEAATARPPESSSSRTVPRQPGAAAATQRRSTATRPRRSARSPSSSSKNSSERGHGPAAGAVAAAASVAALLRQLSLHPGLVDKRHDALPCAKLGALVEQLGDIMGSGHRALVFSQFTGFLAKARKRLDQEGIGYCYLDGRTRRREQVLKRFKEGDDPVFLISLKAGGSGLNLTEADYCFLLDPWWNPAAEAQAIDRTHRIGQTRPVMAYRMIARDTIEERVAALARRKAELFKGVLDHGDLFVGGLTAEDIRGLLG